MDDTVQLRLAPVAAIFLVQLLGACVTTPQEDSIEIVDFGTYTSDRTHPILITITDEVPATVGTVFGIRVTATGEHTGRYEFRWTFPEMQNPENGQVWTEMTGTRDVASDQPQWFLVRINNDWEAKTGDWTIRLSREGRAIAEKVFEVRDPHSTID